MNDIADTLALIERSWDRIETDPFKALTGFETAERELDMYLLGYRTTRYDFKNPIAQKYLPFYQKIMDGYDLIQENRAKEGLTP